MTRRWYVARTEPRRETTASVYVRSLGFDAAVPMLMRRIVLRGCVLPRRELMFPGYCFIRVSMTTRHWAELRRTPGIVALMQGPGDTRPTPLDDAVMGAIQANAHQVIPHDSETFRRGDAIAVIGGPFRELDAIFEDNAGDRVLALITLFGRRTLVPLNASQVARL